MMLIWHIYVNGISNGVHHKMLIFKCIICFVIAIRACEPYPCQYAGVCIALGPQEFECDCTGTGYEGDMCQYGVVNLPQYPTLTAEGSAEQVTISARPAAYITITFVSDDPNNLFFGPPSVTIHYPNTTANFTVQSTQSNLYTVNYVITGMSSDEFPAPQPSTILVTSLNSGPINGYFIDRGIAVGLLQPGCCQPLDNAPSYQCSNGGQSLEFNATCSWSQHGGRQFTPGIVFTFLQGLTLPASISGTELDRTNNILSLNQLSTSDLSEPCTECTSVRVGDNVANVGEDFLPSCTTTFGPTINDINDFLNAESLAYSYFNYANSLYPSWLHLLPINGDHRVHDTNSYQVRLADSTELEDIGCESFPVVEDGLYSVLQYSGELNVSIPTIGMYDIYTPSDDVSPLCFAVNLCEGVMSPFYISIPEDARPFFKTLPFVSNLMDSGWVIDTEALAVSIGENFLNVDTIDRLTGRQYWNGIQDFTVNDHIYQASLAIQGAVNRNFSTNDMICVLEFDGLTSIQYYNLNEVSLNFSSILLILLYLGIQHRTVKKMDRSNGW